MTFFSGTDVSTLIKEGTDRNHFLSLIVNNEGTYTARITRKVEKKINIKAAIESVTTSCYHTYNDNLVVLEDGVIKRENKEESKEYNTIEYFDLTINKAFVPDYFKEINDRIKDIRTKKTTKSSKNLFNYAYIKEFNSKEFNPYSYKNDDYNYYDTKTYKVPTGKESKKELSSIEDEIAAFANKYAMTMALKIVTGSISVNEDSKGTAKAWIKGIDARYKAIFDDIENSLTFNNWIELIVTFVIQEWKEDEIDALVDDLSIKYGEDVHIDEVLTCIADAVSSIIEGWQRELTVESTVLSLINSYIKYLV